MLVRTLVLSLTLFAQTSTVFALSCMLPDAARTFKQHNESDKLYYLFEGRFIPKSYGKGYSFDGRWLGPQGLEQNYRFDVEIKSICNGPWCAKPPHDRQRIVFLEYGSDKRYYYNADPCETSSVKAEPQNREILQQCYTGICKSRHAR